MLKEIKGTMDIKMTLDEANHINELIQKDEPKPIVAFTYTDGGTTFYRCPRCNVLVIDSDKYCKSCGQALDSENVAL